MDGRWACSVNHDVVCDGSQERCASQEGIHHGRIEVRAFAVEDCFYRTLCGEFTRHDSLRREEACDEPNLEAVPSVVRPVQEYTWHPFTARRSEGTSLLPGW